MNPWSWCRRVALAVVLWAAGSSWAEAQTLWQQRKPSQAFLFVDSQAREVGDLLTIIISENTDVDNKEQRSLGKETEASASTGLAHSVKSIFGNSSGALSESGQTSSSRNFDGNAAFSSARLFSDRFTVTVTDVLPNGNLVLSGRRMIGVAGDQRCLVISGVVRWQDIRADNTIQSRYVANLQMYYQDQGAESHFTKQGWLGRATNKLWPW